MHATPQHRGTAGRLAMNAIALSLSLMGFSAAAEEQEATLGDVVVTATGKPEQRAQIAGTVQVIDARRIEESSARSVTDLLAENAVGFFSEWTPAQTSINIRGGASDGQGKDFRSQVLVLVNGRRAGTANLSKLSPSDVERVEIVRGPSSVVYGSQNIGGIINIIMKNGRTAPGTLLEASAGSWGLWQGRAQTGGQSGAFDWYAGLTAGASGNYHSGSGGSKLANTDWDRHGVAAGLGWQVNDNHRLELSLRADGIYDAGFRGSGANIHSKDDRSNRSADLIYSGKLADNRVRWLTHAYAIRDIDEFKWASPVIRNSRNQPSPGTRVDHNTRTLDIEGLRVQPGATRATRRRTHHSRTNFRRPRRRYRHTYRSHRRTRTATAKHRRQPSRTTRPSETSPTCAARSQPPIRFGRSGRTQTATAKTALPATTHTA